MTNLILFVGLMLVATNRVESIYPSGESMTVVEVVSATTITPIVFEEKTMLVTNVVRLRTNSVDLVKQEVKIPHPGMGSKTLKVWRTKPKPAMRSPRDPLGNKDNQCDP